MKKFVSILLMIVLCFSLCSCSEKNSGTESVMDQIKTAVRTSIGTQIVLRYERTGVTNVTYQIYKVEEGVYEVSGKVTVRDQYGDYFTGTYDADVAYDPAKDYYVASAI